MHDPIIRVEHLSFQYPSAHQQQKVLNDINLEIERGSCAGIIGFNGSGKSTLVQHFNGLLRPTKGTVFVDGIDVGDRHSDLRALRQRVGMLFQFPESQLFEQTVFDDVAFGPRRMRMGRREVRMRVQSALDLVSLPHQKYGHRSPFELSGGQRRRVALAGILAMSPHVLILDEPTAGLDGEGRAEFNFYLQRVQREKGVTVVLVSHDMSEVVTLADRIFVMYESKLVMQGTPYDVFCYGDQLHQWGLAVPSLQDLLAALRHRGMMIPDDLLTIDDIFNFLVSHKSSFQTKKLEAEADHR